MAALTDDDLIEVISVFKCRFCQYTAPDPHDVRNHVTRTHMTVKTDANESTAKLSITSLAAPAGDVIIEENHGGLAEQCSDETIHPGEEVLRESTVPTPVAMLGQTTSGLVSGRPPTDGVVMTSEGTIVQAVGDVLNAEGDPVSLAPVAYDATMATDDNVILEYTDVGGDGDTIQVSLPAAMSLKQEVDMHGVVPSLVSATGGGGGGAFSTAGLLGMSVDHRSSPQLQHGVVSAGVTDVAGSDVEGFTLTSAQITGTQAALQSLVTMDNKTLSYDTAASIQASSSVTQTGGSIIEDLVPFTEDTWLPLHSQPKLFTGTRELFLCGQCNTGFVSMEECKKHIEQNHQLSMVTNDSVTADMTISGPDNPAPNKHSLGVQACEGGRRRGRKRKDDRLNEKAGVLSEMCDTEEAEKQQGELAEEASFVDDYRTDLSSVRRVSSRAVKTPRHLLNEYYIGQKKPVDTRYEGIRDAEHVKRRKKWRKKAETDHPGVSVNTTVPSVESREECMGQSDCGVSPEVKDSGGGGDPGLLTEGGGSREGSRAEATIEETSDTAGGEGILVDTDQEYIPSLHEDCKALELDDRPPEKEPLALQPASKQGYCPAPLVKLEESIYPSEEELLGSKMAGHRNPYGQRLTHKFEIEEEQKTAKHSYIFKCKYKSCRGRFLSRETHDIHLKCHRRRPGRNILVCFECEQDFNSWAACKYHLWREHRVDLDLYKCDQCDFRSDMTCKMDLHKVVHREERPYACRECGRGFKQPAQLRNHEVLHEQLQEMDEQLSAQEAKSWFHKQVCDICDKDFANSKTLRNHQMVVHGRLRPFVCPHCDHTASTRGALQLHIRTHTGEKPFKCDRCEFSSSDHNTLRRHRMRHTGEKPYKCPHCPYSCIQSVSIKTHIQYKHSDQMSGLYKCDTCDFNSVNQKLYLAHLSDHEKGLIPSTGVSKVARRHTKKQQTAGVTPLTLYACAQCSYTSKNMATLVGHLVTHKTTTTSGSSVAPPTSGCESLTNPGQHHTLAKTLVLDGTKAMGRVSDVQFELQPVAGGEVISGLPTLQVLSEMPPGIAQSVQPLHESGLEGSATTNVFIKDGMVAELIDDPDQTCVGGGQHNVSSTTHSDYSQGNTQVTYISTAQQSSNTTMEEPTGAMLAVPVEGGGGGDTVYTLRPGQTIVEPLQLLEDVTEESTFICLEDGSIQPISLTDFSGSQMFLSGSESKLLVQDVRAGQVFVEESSELSQPIQGETIVGTGT